MPEPQTDRHIDEFVHWEPSAPPQPSPSSRRSGDDVEPCRNLLKHEAVLMTVLAQDPSVLVADQPALAKIPVPADRLESGPRSHRFHVMGIDTATNTPRDPVVLHAGDRWTYEDRWAASPVAELLADPEFRAQNVYAVASHTLALFERHLGRPIPWQTGSPQLHLRPEAKLAGNAHYSRTQGGVLFGWLPAVGETPALYTSLSYDVIAHEVSHAILDGLRPCYTEPGLPDPRAFHEALADLVALFSVFDLDGVAEALLKGTDGTITFPSDEEAASEPGPASRDRLRGGRAEFLKGTPLLGLAEQLGARRSRRASRDGDGGGKRPPSALRRSVEMAPGVAWKDDPRFERPHRLAEVLVAAFVQTFVTMWARRLDPLRTDGGMDVSRVAEEGTKSARHLLAMLLRAVDYLPPVELELGDVIDSVVTADRRLAPDDQHSYRDALEASFAAFGITAPPHSIVDEDDIDDSQTGGAGEGEGGRADRGTAAGEAQPAQAPPDPDERAARLGIRYEHLNLGALRTSPEEVYQFIWSNATLLGIDVGFSTKVERVMTSTRVGPDGLVVSEILADYTQRFETTAGDLPPGMSAPEGMDPETKVELRGGGVLVFDQFGRFRLHQRKPILDVDRQNRRLQLLFKNGLLDPKDGSRPDDVSESQPFAMLHPEDDD